MTDSQSANAADRVIKALGLSSPGELLRWVPSSYRDFRKPYRSIQACEGRGRVAVIVSIRNRRDYSRDGIPMGSYPDQRPFRISMHVADLSGFECWMTVFGAVFPWKNVREGQTVTVYAETEVWNGQLQLKSPELIPDHLVGKMKAMYRGKRGKASVEAVGAAIAEVLHDGVSSGVDALVEHVGLREDDILTRIGSRYRTLTDFFISLHQPPDLKEAFRALDDARMINAEHIRNMARKVKARPPEPASCISLTDDVLADLIDALPYPLTGDQRQAITEIVVDLRSPIAMRRLLSGDVGTGKSVTFLVPAISAIRAGAVVGIICPNVLLAKQLTDEANAFFPDTRSVLVTSGAKKAIQRSALLIGTTALISALDKAKLVPDLLICDEQHRLGREQREALLADHTNFLEATATAIPRTIAIATHGGMDVSVLRECPVSKDIVTRIVTPADRGKLFDFLRNIAQKGGQIAIIYPRLDDDGSAKSSVVAAVKYWERLFPGQVAMLHGRMSEQDKFDALEAMKHGERQILVASSVIEVGVTIKGLRGVMVVDADRYGVSQLHQLRGRLAREGGRGYMFLYLTSQLEDYEGETIDRLRLVEAERDGFELAEKDAYARGFGDMSENGDQQNGRFPTLFHGIRLKPDDLLDR